MKTAAGTTLIRNGQLVDGTGAPPIPQAALVIENGRITYTGLEAEAPWVSPEAPVIDARDVLRNPASVLGRLCARLGVEFSERMLRWEPGRRATDGVWAKYWYAAVEASSGFEPWRPPRDPVPSHLAGVLEECEPLYRVLWEARIT